MPVPIPMYLWKDGDVVRLVRPVTLQRMRGPTPSTSGVLVSFTDVVERPVDFPLYGPLAFMTEDPLQWPVRALDAFSELYLREKVAQAQGKKYRVPSLLTVGAADPHLTFE